MRVCACMIEVWKRFILWLSKDPTGFSVDDICHPLITGSTLRQKQTVLKQNSERHAELAHLGDLSGLHLGNMMHCKVILRFYKDDENLLIP